MRSREVDLAGLLAARLNFDEVYAIPGETMEWWLQLRAISTSPRQKFGNYLYALQFIAENAYLTDPQAGHGLSSMPELHAQTKPRR